jgi:ERCC4-type nuclease
MIIKIDIREHELIVQLQRLIALNDVFKNIILEKINLPIGDIIIFDPIKNEDRLIIERKSINDLLASIKDGRYEEQSYRLNGTSTHNHNIIYLIEGDINRVNRFKDNVKDKATVYSAIFSLNYYKGYSVIRTFNIEETSIFICNTVNKLLKEKTTNKTPYYKNGSLNILENTKVTEKQKEEINQEELIQEKDKTQKQDTTPEQEEPQQEQEEPQQEQDTDKNYVGVIKKIKKENITPNNIDEIMLCQIPGISSVTALAIINKFKSISNLIKEIEKNNECLKDVTYTTNKSQIKKISKTCILNIEKFLLKK